MSKVMILVGSGTENSRSLNLAQNIEKALQRQNIKTELVDLRILQLPQYDATVENTDSYDDKTRNFLKKSKQVDGCVWVTPVYHNSYSSLLKTAIDWQHFSFDGKVLGTASHGGQSPAAVDQLLMVARAQHFVSIPTRVCTHNNDFDDDKRLTNPAIVERIDHFANEYSDFIKRFSN